MPKPWGNVVIDNAANERPGDERRRIFWLWLPLAFGFTLTNLLQRAFQLDPQTAIACSCKSLQYRPLDEQYSAYEFA